MTLTEEEKKKIEEEEKYRAEVKSGAPVKKHSSFLKKFLLVCFLGLSVLFIIGSLMDDDEYEAPSVSINADVKYSSIEVAITNRDSFDWTSCELVLNLSNTSYYQMYIDGIPSTKTKTFALVDFVKVAATERFNPSKYSVGNFAIRCQTPSGKGFWSVGSKL